MFAMWKSAFGSFCAFQKHHFSAENISSSGKHWNVLKLKQEPVKNKTKQKLVIFNTESDEDFAQRLVFLLPHIAPRDMLV